MTTIDLPRAQTGPEPQRLLTTVLGDYWYLRDEHIPSATLVRLLAEFDISEDGARAAIRRLTARGLLRLRRTGRTTAYAIPERTSEFVMRRIHRMLFFGGANEPWDGQWTTVAFSVPEGDREVRASLRAGLRALQFGVLYDGLWVTPHDRVSAACALLERLGVSTATVLRVREPITGSRLVPLASAFDLHELATRYREFAERYEPLLDRIRAGDVSPADALALRTALRSDWRDFPEIDPDLPAELLPEGWPRERARRCFIEIHDLLGPVAELRFRQIVGATDPNLAALASHFTSTQVASFVASGARPPGAPTRFEDALESRHARSGLSRPR
jgi:phenylacetic acid degradation operon negative regulatory protein